MLPGGVVLAFVERKRARKAGELIHGIGVQDITLFPIHIDLQPLVPMKVTVIANKT